MRLAKKDAGLIALPSRRNASSELVLHVTGGAMADISSRRRVREHRERLRAQGLRPVQIWVPDMNAEGFAAEAHRQSRAVAASAAAEDDQAFVDSVSDWPPE